MGSVSQTLDGGYILGGASESGIGGDKTEANQAHTDYWVVKLGQGGVKEWDKTIGDTYQDYLISVEQSADGGYILGGYFEMFDNEEFAKVLLGTRDYWAVKLDLDPMPVTLTKFTASKENNSAILTWTTTSETRSDRFEVQHNIDGKSWKLLGTVAARGESTNVISYQYVHADPLIEQENLYRLKMIDIDGTFAYSHINSLIFKKDTTLSIFPNPALETLTIKTADWKNVENIKLVDNRGILVYNSSSIPVKNIDIRKFNTGLYVLKVTNTDGSFVTRKIVIDK